MSEIPDVVFDDLGIYHTIEAPLPASYTRVPCVCGIIHKWEDSSTFELYGIEMIENGYKIKVEITDYESVSVDAPEDLKKLTKYL